MRIVTALLAASILVGSWAGPVTSAAAAESPTARVSGDVLDHTGAPAWVTVTATNVDTAAKVNLSTGPSGSYSLDLSPGSWTIGAQQCGYYPRARIWQCLNTWYPSGTSAAEATAVSVADEDLVLSDLTLPTPKVAPGAIAAPQAVLDDEGRVTVTWQPPADDGGLPITRYKIHWRIGGSGGSHVYVQDPNRRSYTFEGSRAWPHDEPYTFSVQAENGQGDGLRGADSQPVMVKWVTPAVQPAPSVSASNGIVVARRPWPSTNPDGARSALSDRYTLHPGGQTCEVKVGYDCTFRGLENGTEYTVTHEAINAAGTSAPSPHSKVVVPIAIPIATAVPTVRQGEQPRSLVVTWPEFTEHGTPVTGYTVKLHGQEGTAYQRTCTTADLQCTFDDLPVMWTYRAEVIAHSAAGDGRSAWSTPTGVTTQPTPSPAQPTPSPAPPSTPAPSATKPAVPTKPTAPRPAATISLSSTGSRIVGDAGPDRSSGSLRVELQKRDKRGSWAPAGVVTTKGVTKSVSVPASRGVYRARVLAGDGYRASSWATVSHGPKLKARASAVSKASVLSVDVNPNLKTGSYTATVQRWDAASRRWVHKVQLQTKGKSDTVKVDLPAGKYRVIVEGRDGYRTTTSRTVTLKR